MTHRFISEEQAAEKLGISTYTLRRRVTGQSPYDKREHLRLRISFTKISGRYRYSEQDTDREIRKSACCA